VKPGQSFCEAILDFDGPRPGRLWKALVADSVATLPDGGIVVRVPFVECTAGTAYALSIAPRKLVDIEFRAIGDRSVRVTAAFGERRPDPQDPMLEMSADMAVSPLRIEQTDTAWLGIDASGRERLRIARLAATATDRPTLVADGVVSGEPAVPHFDAVIYPDGSVAVPLMSIDSFYPRVRESVPMGWLANPDGTVFSLIAFHAAAGEAFCGTGERFARMNLAGGTYVLENTDACGVNSRRAYKNVPLFISNRGYGVLLLTSAHVRLSLADVSTRASIARVDDDLLDVFVVGGGNPAAIVREYQSITGRPRAVPRWSYGIWMSRMSYRSAIEVDGIARRLRAEGYPCDVLHIDPGWFEEDYACDWKFSRERFPQPAAFMANLRQLGYRISLWQLPTVFSDIPWYADAVKQGLLVERVSGRDESNFAALDVGTAYDSGAIDLANPAAVMWYEHLLEEPLRLGAAVYKADFGEYIDPASLYPHLPFSLLHNLYSLLYQRTVWETTHRVHGEGLIFGRGGWTGSQRYPVHWSGDVSATWDGMAASLRGGLHLGLSGFAFWAHDIPGFHGLPDFMRDRADDELCARWTQLGVFSSHMRYHGTSPREPWEFPSIAGLLKAWWRLRYALVPYL